MSAFNPLTIVTSVTSLWFYEAIPSQVTLSGSNVTGWNDQGASAFNMAEGTAGNGGTYLPTGMGGRGCIRLDGIDDYLVNTGTAGQTTIGGIDKAFFGKFAVRRVNRGTGGDCIFSCGLSSNANPFFRCVEGSADVYEFRKRDGATSAGAGDGGTSTQLMNGTIHIITWYATGTTFTAKVDGVIVASGTMDVGDMSSAGNLDRMAFGALARNTVSAFSQADIGAAYGAAGTPNASEETRLDTWFSQYYGPNNSSRLCPGARLSDVRMCA